MGSSISSFFAYIVLEDLEKYCLSILGFPPIFYYRYVDDIILGEVKKFLKTPINFNEIEFVKIREIVKAIKSSK